MGGLESHGAGAVELGLQFGSDFVGAGMLGDLGDGWPEVACAVCKAWLAAQGPPAVVGLFGGKGQVAAPRVRAAIAPSLDSRDMPASSTWRMRTRAPFGKPRRSA